MVGGRVTGPAALPIVGRVFFLLAVIALVISGVLTAIEMYGPRKASASGKVVAAEYYPLVEFSTSDGTVIRFTNSVHSGSLGVGDSVAVAYDPKNPQNASVDSFAGRWFLPGLAGLFGAIFLAISIVLNVLGRILIRRMIANSRS